MSNNSFMGIFARSPIKPLEQHIDKVSEAAELLENFFEAAFAKDWVLADSIQREISIIEQHADQMKRDIRLGLPNGLFMAVARADILSILSKQDTIANIAKDISGRIVGREMAIPESLHVDLRAFVRRCIDAALQAKLAINELDDLLEAGFAGRVAEFTERMIDKIDTIEDETDRMQRKLRRAVFNLEKEMNPIDVMFLYQIIEQCGELADIAEGVGSRLELVLAKA